MGQILSGIALLITLFFDGVFSGYCPTSAGRI